MLAGHGNTGGKLGQENHEFAITLGYMVSCNLMRVT